MSSGVTANDDCVTKFQELKIGHKFKYIIFNLSADNKEIVVEKTGEPSEDYDSFISSLSETECRWAVYDFEFEKEGAGKRSKLVFISWSPDDAKIKNKMLAASSKEALRNSFVGIAFEIQATDLSEIAYETVKDKASRGS